MKIMIMKNDDDNKKTNVFIEYLCKNKNVSWSFSTIPSFSLLLHVLLFVFTFVVMMSMRFVMMSSFLMRLMLI